ncbi:MAG TPA: 3-hydroxyacyl-CoA dehydrogenase NAD-binding domain-containing protein, partial [Calditrichia bacterium]|nr:3-hydroxyacyl-CoA dehydrogenase NAD-binding domain-containing protein [Calditrichia bacterium]
MTLNERYQNVAVIGAGGKMGSGISLLLAQELTLRQLHPDNTGKKFRLILMDVSADALEGLKSYLAKQAERFVQKKGEKLAAAIPALATPDAAATFVAAMNGLLETTTDLKGLAGSTLVFEAILEKLDLKLKIYTELKEICHPQAFFFTNTSSIPMKAL